MPFFMFTCLKETFILEWRIQLSKKNCVQRMDTSTSVISFIYYWEGKRISIISSPVFRSEFLVLWNVSMKMKLTPLYIKTHHHRLLNQILTSKLKFNSGGTLFYWGYLWNTCNCKIYGYKWKTMTLSSDNKPMVKNRGSTLQIKTYGQ